MASADAETVKFLLDSAKAKLWRHAYVSPDAARAQAEAFQGDTYSTIVRDRFLAEFRDAEALQIPKGYAFRPEPGADVVLPFRHWGWEREPDAGERQRRLARRMIEAGADAVVGGHPHVTQGADLVAGRPVVWSLGNFLFDGFEDFAPARRGWLLRMTVDAQGVRDWDTVQADLDLQGIPHPDLQAWTPCGQRGVGTVLRCQAGAQR
jgi:hypothetical protein